MAGAKHVSAVGRPDGCLVETPRRSVPSAPQKLVRSPRPASQSGGLTSQEGPGVQERLARGTQVLVEDDLAALIENAQVHAPGMQIDAAVESVLALVKAH